MWSKPIGEIVVLSLVVVSILISGCTVISPSTSTPSPTSSPTVTTPTLTPSTDYSSELTKYYEAGTAIMERPFTKSINERGNDVYKGVGRNATMPGAGSVTIVVEFTKSQAEAKAVYDQQIATKDKQGYVLSDDGTAYWKANCKECTGVWAGYNGKQLFLSEYGYLTDFQTWAATTESWTST